MNPFIIIDAWVESLNPTPARLKLAEERAKVCSTCPHKVINDGVIRKLIKDKEILSDYKCELCSCPLPKLIFANTTKDTGACMLWNE
jgi:hypothetical protein